MPAELLPTSSSFLSPPVCFFAEQPHAPSQAPKKQKSVSPTEDTLCNPYLRLLAQNSPCKWENRDTKMPVRTHLQDHIEFCAVNSIAHSFGKRKAFFANNKHTAPDKAETAARKYPRGGSYFFFCRQGCMPVPALLRQNPLTSAGCRAVCSSPRSPCPRRRPALRRCAACSGGTCTGGTARCRRPS